LREWPTRRLLAVLGVLVGLVSVLSLGVGTLRIAPAELWSALWSGEPNPYRLVLVELRVPRTLLALLVGGSLGLAGAAMQGLLRNPLAEPGVVGVSGMAAFGAVVAFYTGWAALWDFALPIGGFAGAALGVALLQLLAGRTGSTLTLILAGIAINSLAGALTSLALNLSPNPYAAYEILFWLMGSLADRTIEHVALAAPFMIGGWAMLISQGRALDALSLGEDAARSLGIEVARTTWIIVLGSALAVGAAVSIAGVIGFVGLVVPHILRPLVGHRPGKLLAASAFGGALLTLLADILLRSLRTGVELKIGVLTALIGAPFFLMLVLRGRRTLP
jgi:iron complex transport system permease protein